MKKPTKRFWRVVPIKREEELGTRTVFLVVDPEYNAHNYTGHAIAECGSEQDAIEVAYALNFTK